MQQALETKSTTVYKQEGSLLPHFIYDASNWRYTASQREANQDSNRMTNNHPHISSAEFIRAFTELSDLMRRPHAFKMLKTHFEHSTQTMTPAELGATNPNHTDASGHFALTYGDLGKAICQVLNVDSFSPKYTVFCHRKRTKQGLEITLRPEASAAFEQLGWFAD